MELADHHTMAFANVVTHAGSPTSYTTSWDVTEDVWRQAQISKMTYHRIDRGVGVRRPDPTIIRSLARVLEQDEADTLAAVT